MKGNGARIVSEGYGDILIKQTLKFEFTTNINQEKYKALIVDKNLALEMGTSMLKAKSDSQLVANQVLEKFHTKEPQLVRYMQKVRSLSSCFTSFEIEHAPCEQNFRAVLLSKLTTSKTTV